MLDKNTFGDTPAAIYLADLLNERNNPKLTRKVSSKIHSIRTLIGQLEASNSAGTLSAHSIGAIVSMMRDNADISYSIEEKDVIVIELTTNIIIGEMKSLQRRVTRARHLEHRQAQLAGQAETNQPIRAKTDDEKGLGYLIGYGGVSTFVPHPVKVAHIREDITSETLKARSRRKLVRTGKPNTLYPQGA